MDNKSEIQVVKECLKGTQSAFKTLYNMYQGYVYTICVRYGVSAIEVKDHMQIIFMEIFKSLEKYDSERAKFKTWLTQITINQILLQRRKNKIDYSTLEDEKINLIESKATISVEAQMDEEIMCKLLSRMPEKFISVFNLFIIDGYSHAEIAEKLNISQGSSRILLHRGREWAINELKFFFRAPKTLKRKAL